MCGIAGLWPRERGPDGAVERTMHAMLACIEHRGPDDSGVWADQDAGVWLGHRRLSIIDLSPLGHQPMLLGRGRPAIVFNGEIYNFAELRRELEDAGERFASTSDTEVLLRGYERWGERVLDRLVGMFAFAVWNAAKGELFLARDRAGEKPLYYAIEPWGVAFSSEVEGLARIPGIDTTLDEDALALYLQYQYVPAPHSIYRGIRKLPPAHAMVIARGRAPRIWRYWDPVPIAYGPRLLASDGEALAQLETLLRAAIRGQMISDVPLGAFLSGGIDSTAVVSYMTELSATPVQTFTIGFDVAEFDESRHAEAVARHLGTQHTVEYLTERDALDLIPRIPVMYGEPFSDPSALPTHLLSRIARKHVTVSLSGDGGDEAFGGYGRYDQLELLALAGRLGGPLSPLARAVLSRAPGRVGRGAKLLGLPSREMYLRRVNVFEPADVLALTGRLPVLHEFERAWKPPARGPVRQRAMLADLLTYLPEAILVKVDRAAMAVSLETRAPFLDHRVLEFALRLPPRLVYRKRLLKQLVYRRVPRALLDRPKQGFGVPLGRWFRGELRELLLDLLTPERMALVGVGGYEVVERTLRVHNSGERDLSPRLWALLVLGLWHDTHRFPSRHEGLQTSDSAA